MSLMGNGFRSPFRWKTRKASAYLPSKEKPPIRGNPTVLSSDPEATGVSRSLYPSPSYFVKRFCPDMRPVGLLCTEGETLPNGGETAPLLMGDYF